MNRQLSFFSSAVDHLQNAYNAIECLEFERAKEELTVAKEIDSYISTLDTTAKLIDFFEAQHRQYHDLPTFLARTWQSIPTACKQHKLHPGEAELADDYLTKIVQKHCNANSIFIDGEEILHWGCCYLIDAKYEQARKLLLDTVTTSHPLRADLWGYYGDACIACQRPDEALAAYLRAVVIDPQNLDLYRIQNEDIKALFAYLLKQHPEPQARALLLFDGWLKGLFKIPKLFSIFLNQYSQLKRPLADEIPYETCTRLHYFAICLCYDQSQPADMPMDYQYRERMCKLDEELFKRYMAKVAESL